MIRINKAKIIALLLGITQVTLGQVIYFSGESDAKSYFEKNTETLDPIEGIWSVTEIDDVFFDRQIVGHDQHDDEGRVAIVKSWGNGYKAIKLSGEEYDIFQFEATSISGYYLTKISFQNGKQIQKCNANVTGGRYLTIDTRLDRDIVAHQCEIMFAGTKLEYAVKQEAWKFEMNIKFNMVKVYPTTADLLTRPTKKASSGTGFAISNAGHIVTNYHVVENAKTITVKGVNGDFNSSVKARLELSDKNNDLAIVKLENGTAITGTIPYVVASKADVVGSDVFALGYPLRATMGDEVKLTNGIISANSGFQGDITKYQVSVPVQPGNSGGPLINSQGNLIGVVNAKHIETENVSYAVKSIYLQSLIASLTGNISLPQTNLLTSKTLSQKVQLVKQFVYVIEVDY